MKKSQDVRNLLNELLENLKKYGKDISPEDAETALESLKLLTKVCQEEEKRKSANANALEKQEHDEHVASVTSMDLPMDWSNAFACSEVTAGVHTDSIPDGLIMSLNNLGRVDIEYISEITGEPCKNVIETLRGSIYQNPETWGECFYRGWETADEYLSGNMLQKLRTAKKADREYNGYFADNIRAIRNVIPAAIGDDDIFISLGSPWIPSHIIDEFIVWLIEGHDGESHLIRHIYSNRESWEKYQGVRHNEETGSWEIPSKSIYRYTRYSVGCYSTYGTDKMGALTIIEKMLNLRSVVVRTDGETDKAETLMAQEKQKIIAARFREWVFKDEDRKKELREIYESRFGCVRTRHYNGSFLTFPTMSSNVTLYDYQKDAVARIIFSANTLLAHDVGSGKTYEMIAAGMEMRRMGISKKNLYVVPNSLIGQWKKIFLEMYPFASLKVVEPKNMNSAHRKKTLEEIRDLDFDGIIMPYSCFDSISTSKENEEAALSEALAVLKNSADCNLKKTKVVKRRIESVKRALQEVILSAKNEDEIYFDELKINTLFVDEAHNYKNIKINTGFSDVRGISVTGSKKCRLMMEKVRCVQKQNNGRGVVFATGTPITNSVSDIFIMQKYLQSGELKLLEIDSFEAWCGMFAETSDEFEVDIDTGKYRMSKRLSEFHNIPELTSILSSIADFHQVLDSAAIPVFRGYTDALIPKTDELGQYLDCISYRVDDIRNGNVSKEEDNMLKVTVDGRKAALDIRLVNAKAAFDYNSKVYRCAENVFQIYTDTAASKSTQLVFCDTSTPKEGFNIYDELTRILVIMGIPREEIAYIHDAGTEKAREALFADVRRGTVRVLIGSTFKLGLGVNVQDRLIALHHLDVPWRPADMVQREGRILRQGNMNKEVRIFRYITEGSFDAYSWQLLETKQKFICSLLSGSIQERSGSEIGDTILNYAEVKAIAIGNPLIKKRFEAANELTRFRSLQRKAFEQREKAEAELAEIPGKVKSCERNIELAEKDRAAALADKSVPGKEERKVIRAKLFEAVQSNILMPDDRELMTYRGFKIILPANMVAEKPFVWVVGSGKYYVEMGDTETGAIIRVDNRINSFDAFIEKQNELMNEALAKEKALKAELRKKVSYTEEIESCKALIEKYDKELGVDK